MKRILLIASIVVVYILTWNNTPLAAYEGCPFINRFGYMFFHANVFHLIANIICIWSIKRHYWESVAIGVICSFAATSPTIGISGVIFATIGITCGIHMNRKALLYSLATALIIGLMPSISLLLHIWALIIGYIYGWCRETIRIYNSI